jgi:hypothetical protein
MDREGRSKKKKRFLDEYKLDEAVLVGGDVASGRPEVSRAVAPDGSEVLIKFWARTRANLDIEDIWRSEIRQLQRLAAIPRADELFVPMFFIVVDPGQGSPLEIFWQAKNQPDAISQPRLPRHRHLIWANGLGSPRRWTFCTLRGSFIATSIRGRSLRPLRTSRISV